MFLSSFLTNVVRSVHIISVCVPTDTERARDRARDIETKSQNKRLK